MKQTCKDYEREGCLIEPDERFTLNFDDIGEPPIYLCSHCGPDALALNDMLMKALSKDPSLAKKLAEELDKAEAKLKKERN